MQYVNVDVTAICKADGSIEPVTVQYDDFPYKIEGVRGRRPTKVPKTGGNGFCYSVIIKGQMRHLYVDVSKGMARWVLEKLDGPEKKARHCCADLRT